MRRHVWWAGLALTFLVAAAAGPTPALTLSVSPSAAQYEESLDIFPNPERGWFWNRGFARLMNPRPSVLVLRNRATGAMSRIPLRLDLRQVAPNSEGVLSAVEQVQLPTGSGSYDVGLHFPDASPGIAHRVEYALRLAGEGLWDPATGIHCLGIEIGSR